MNVQVDRFLLEGCQCRLKFDPKELQELLYQKIMEKFEKNTKHFKQGNGDLVISGIFTAIDEGNFALHFMLAFLGKASLSCQAKVVNKGQVILDEPFRAAATCSCFTNGRKQLKYDVQVIADQIVKKTVKLIKAIPK